MKSTALPYIALATLIAAFAATPTKALTMSECSVKYKAFRDAGTLNGMKWNDFRHAQCGDDPPSALVSPQPSQAQISAIRASCQADYRFHCANVPTGGRQALACLQNNLATLSSACQTAVGAVGGSASSAPAPGTPPALTSEIPQAPTLSDAQRRKLELPSIRAASDCYALAVKSDARLLAAVQQNSLGELIAEKTSNCPSAVQQMIAVYDKLNGPGTGVVFFRGPYAADLPRAVMVRIKPEIDRLTAEAAHQGEVKAQVLQSAKQAADLLKQKMYECTTRELFELAKSGETAAVISDAALTFCRNDVDAAVRGFFEEARQEYPNTTDAEYPNFQKAVEETIAKSVQASAVQVRANLAGQTAGMPPATPTPSTAPVAAAPVTTPVTESANRTPTECLKVVRQGLQGKVYEQDTIVSIMIELCRPEIETAARAAFLQNPTSTLDAERQKAVAGAIIDAKQIVATP